MVRPILSGFVALVVALVAFGLPACQQGREGDRCNPDLIQSGGATPQYNEDECNTGAGLSCQVPPTCVIAVCCPSQPPYSDPNCACFANPSAGCACTTSGGLALELFFRKSGFGLSTLIADASRVFLR